MVKKKGQAAMEFLMTYGWAILVVLAAIAALAYFGVLSPDRFLPEKCTMPSGIACLDFAITSTGANAGDITLSIQNAAGFDMRGVFVNLNSTDSDPLCTGSHGVLIGSLGNGVKDSYVISCTALPASGQKFKGSVNMNYTNAGTGLVHAKIGELIIKIP